MTLEENGEIYTTKNSSPNTNRMTKLRIMIWTGHVACMSQMRNSFENFS
jgi:hypothetical protein